MSGQVSLETIFLEARTQRSFLDKDLPDGTLKELYDLLKWGPTSANSCPARFLFATTADAKERLAACADEGNQPRIRTAPATAVIAYDERFYEQFPKLAPEKPKLPDIMANKPELAQATAFRNGTLQGGYFIIAARCLGLDCAPMSGFDNEAVDRSFFADTSWKSNFICCIGYGDPEALHPRAARLDFDEACQVI